MRMGLPELTPFVASLRILRDPTHFPPSPGAENQISSPPLRSGAARGNSDARRTSVLPSDRYPNDGALLKLRGRTHVAVWNRDRARDDVPRGSRETAPRHDSNGTSSSSTGIGGQPASADPQCPRGYRTARHGHCTGLAHQRFNAIDQVGEIRAAS